MSAFIALKTPCFQIKDIEHEGWLTKQGKLLLFPCYVSNTSSLHICTFMHQVNCDGTRIRCGTSIISHFISVN